MGHLSRRGRQRISDPTWKSGPTHKEPNSSEHAIHSEDFGSGGFDFDGFGVDEAESVEGEPLVTIMEMAVCSRDGCEAVHTRRLLFTTQPLSEDEKYALDAVSGGEVGAYAFDHAERVGPESIEIGGTQITAERIIENEPEGQCCGRVEPDPEPEWRDV